MTEPEKQPIEYLTEYPVMVQDGCMLLVQAFAALSEERQGHWAMAWRQSRADRHDDGVEYIDVMDAMARLSTSVWAAQRRGEMTRG